MAQEKRKIHTVGQKKTMQQNQPAPGRRQPLQAKPAEEELKKHGDKIRNVGG